MTFTLEELRKRTPPKEQEPAQEYRWPDHPCRK